VAKGKQRYNSAGAHCFEEESVPINFWHLIFMLLPICQIRGVFLPDSTSHLSARS
jgi:hypothetical protein